MLTSYADRFAQKWGRRCRGAMLAAGSLFGCSLSSEKAEAREWELAEPHEGSMFSAGVRGESTGRPADLLIVDDLHKNAEEAASETIRERVWDGLTSNFLTRLSNEGKIVAVGTRWHAEDAIGRMKAKWDDEGVPFLEVNLPAFAGHDDPLGRAEGEPLCPQLKSAKFLSEQQRTLSTYRWNALYGGYPSQHEKAEFPEEYFDECIWTDAIPAEASLKVVALDPSKGKNAKKGDFQAAILVSVLNGIAYVDAMAERCPIGKAVDNTLALAFRHGVQHVAYESNGFQELIGGIFDEKLAGHRFHGITIHTIEHTASKEGRIQSLDPFLRNRELRFVRSPGCRLLVQQLREFPMAAHDDGPDALEMALRLALSLMRTDDQVTDFTRSILSARGFV